MRAWALRGVESLDGARTCRKCYEEVCYGRMYGRVERFEMEEKGCVGGKGFLWLTASGATLPAADRIMVWVSVR
ncbi:hypothetical protein E2C01_057838 [Portunus trituberculatus]|uniref:Uncharacterized protein n=1 Tax=Portunus trituberculatus TaxID=210409 RepID=A0A5B7H270_PORTR|nr:hypothetical protein [Portunus trituberculatus]